MHGDCGLVELVHHHSAGALFSVVGDFIHAAQSASACINFAAFAARHGPNARRASGPNFSLEARWQLELVDWNFFGRRHCVFARDWSQSGGGHFLCATLLPNGRLRSGLRHAQARKQSQCRS